MEVRHEMKQRKRSYIPFYDTKLKSLCRSLVYVLTFQLNYNMFFSFPLTEDDHPESGYVKGKKLHVKKYHELPAGGIHVNYELKRRVNLECARMGAKANNV